MDRDFNSDLDTAPSEEQPASNKVPGEPQPPSVPSQVAPSRGTAASAPLAPDASAPVPPRPHRWRWVAALAGVVAADMLIQIVFSAIGMLLIDLSGQVGVLSRAQADALIDDATLLVILTQLVRIVAMWPWWRHMARETLVPGPALNPSHSQRIRSVAGIILLGLGLQFVLGLVLTLILPLFPAVMDEYTELMDSAGASDPSLLSVLSVTVLAAVGEEVVCRGIMLEYALRAATGYRGPARHATIDARAFWIANVLQALAFGLLHLNVVQSTYAFLLGLLMGWVYWKTGDLRYPMVLHLAVNGASYVIEPVSAALPGGVFLALLIACLVAGARLFADAWGRPDLGKTPRAKLPDDPSVG